MSGTPTTPPTPDGKRPRAEKGTVRKRVGEVLEMILLGASDRDIRDRAREEGWGVSVGQLKRYKTQAYRELEKGAAKDRERRLTWHLEARKRLFSRAMGLGDLRTALAIARDLGELETVYPANPALYSAEEVRALVLRLADTAQQFVPEARLAEYAEAVAAGIQDAKAERDRRRRR